MGNVENTHAKEVCKIGMGEETCSYLMMGGDGWECAKKTVLQSTITVRRKDGQMNAMGDNCQGPPHFEKAPV